MFPGPSFYPLNVSYGVSWKVSQAVHCGFPTSGDGRTMYSQVVDGSRGGESESCAELGSVKLQLWMYKGGTHISKSCLKIFTVRKI